MNRATRRDAMAILTAAGLSLAAWPAAPAGAGERKLSAAEIEEALTGNTIEGDWAGRPYKSYFDPSGSTIYAEDGRQPSMGRWKADAVKGAYCSWWEVSGWACYEVLDGGPDRIIWVSPGSGKHYPAKVLTGKQL